LPAWLLSSLAQRLSPELEQPAAIGTAPLRDWETWLRTLFPAYVQHPFADHHREFWQWVWSIRKGERVRPFIAIWPRGGAKSTSAEMATVALGARQARTYVLYISGTQEQADDHVGSIGSMLESSEVERFYPEMGTRLKGKYGNSRGWRRNRLRTASGFTIDAIGLDSAARGVKLEEHRPDLLVLDDVDNQKDTDATIDKKIATITRSLLPAGSSDAVVLGAQNLIHPNSVFARLSDGRADFLAQRIVSGPVPAVQNLQHEDRDGIVVLTGGEPTWQGQDLDTVQFQMNEWGLTAFLAEAQHEVSVLRQRIFLSDWWKDKNRYDPDWHQDATQIVQRYATFDTAMKDKDLNDYTACTVFDVMSDHRLRVRHAWKRRLQFPDLVAAIEETARDWNRDGKLRQLSIEDRGSGTGAFQTIQAASPPQIRRMVVAFEPRGSKDYRARQAAVWCARGGVLLPSPSKSVPWLADYESELYGFPDVEHDDQVDTFSQGVIWLQQILERWWQVRLKKATEETAHQRHIPARNYG
jgi:predicted phage terminase large subunit-like protein